MDYLLKNEKILTTVFEDPLAETINLLEIFEKRVQELDKIFPKEEEAKRKKLIRN